MKVKLKYLAIAWCILFAITLWAFVDSLSATVTRPFIRNTELKWSSYHAYKILEDEYIVKVKDVRDLITASKQNKAWARKTVKKLKLKKLKPKKRVLKILKYIKKLYRYDIKVRFIEDARRLKRANCAAYADTMYILCKASGIPVRYIIGYDGDACHAWCRVKIGKKWYWSDPTRNDGLYGYALSRTLWTDYHNIVDEW